MEAPEKIYLFENPISGDADDGWLSSRSCDEDVEYIRTDAFIEKALKFLDGCIPDYIELKHTNVDTFMDVDNERFIEDFKNYIKRGIKL